MDARIDMDIAIEAGSRWEQREETRRRTVAKLREHRVAEVEPPERVSMRMHRLSEQATRRASTPAAPATGVSLLQTVALERVIGKPDFQGMDFIEMAIAVSRFVGRISLRSASGGTHGFGTGFMVSPRLLLTNNHVLTGVEDARYSEVEFDYQKDRYGRLRRVVPFRLDPASFFLTDRELDFTLVAVAERSVDGDSPLTDYGWSRLIGQQGKALLGECLNIVQHPRGQEKQIVLRSNELVDLLDNFAHYVTDTEPGSSGSPVYNDQWELVALHHSGVPAMRDGQILTKDGQAWGSDMDPSLIDWVANEGVRVSSLVRFIKDAPIIHNWKPLRRALLEDEPPNPMETAAKAAEHSRDGLPQSGLTPQGAAEQVITWIMPLRVTVTAGLPMIESAVTGGGGLSPPISDASRMHTLPALRSARASVVEAPPDARALQGEAVSIDPDYDARGGYDPEFLGKGSRRVERPGLSPEQLGTAAVNRRASGEDRHLLDYHHYSVVMNAERRTAFFTAANINGRLRQDVRRERDRWFYDPRIARDEQAGDEIYEANPLDRGHLVRRLDAAWGDSLDLAKVANDDTFHFTNCAPQHEGFNRSKTTWGGMEDYILGNAELHDLRVTVFTGPVLRGTDPPYRGIQLPLEFWKVVVILKKSGKLSATAYLLSQAALIEELPAEAFSYGRYRTYQVPVRKIQKLTGLDFTHLVKHDPIETQKAFGFEATGVKELESPDQALL